MLQVEMSFSCYLRMRLFVDIFREKGCLLNLGCLPSRHRNLSMYQVSSCHSLSVTCTYMSSYSLFVVVFQEMNCLHTFKHDNDRWVRELHLSTKFYIVSAPVSELCKLKQNKEPAL